MSDSANGLIPNAPVVHHVAMALNPMNEQTERLARELAATTGESITEAVVVALRERLERERARKAVGRRLTRMAEELSAFPVLDSRSADEILGYGESGIPG